MTIRHAFRRLRTICLRPLRDTRGATAVEYGLILVLVVVALIASLKQVADVNTALWTNVSDKVSRAN